MLKYILVICVISLSVPAWADITIGVAGPMTGPVASFGENMKIGAQLAIEDINKAGGVLGQKLVMDLEDDACEPKQAVAVANQLAQKKVALVIGHACSGSSVVASSIYAEANILMIDSFGSLEKITRQGYPTVFRVSVSAPVLGDRLAAFTVQKFSPKNVVIVSETRAVAQELGTAAIAAFQHQNIKTVNKLEYNAGEKDFSTLTTRLKEAAPDVVLCLCYPLEAGLIARQIQTAGIKSPFIGANMAASKDFLNITGNTSQDIYYQDYAAAGPGAVALKAKLAAQKIPLDAAITQAYATVQMFAQAAQAAGKLDSAAIAAALKSKTFDSVIGHTGFDSYGDVIDTHLVMYHWQNGQLTPVK